MIGVTGDIAGMMLEALVTFSYDSMESVFSQNK